MRKFISLFIAVCVATGCLITNVVMAEDILQLSVSSAEAESGDSVSIAVNVENNVNGISNFDMTLTYDSEYLTYVNYTAGLYGGTLIVNGTNPGEVKFSAADYKNSSGDGAIVYFNFSVNDTDEENVNTELNLTVDRICYIDSTYTVIAMENEVTAGSVLINKVDVTTTESTTVTTTESTTVTTTESTTVTTTESTTESTTAATTTTESTTEDDTTGESPESALYGDINGDGEVNINDVSLLLNYVLSGDKDIIEVDFVYADVSADGKIDTTDVAMLLQKVLNSSYVMTCEE